MPRPFAVMIWRQRHGKMVSRVRQHLLDGIRAPPFLAITPVAGEGPRASAPDGPANFTTSEREGVLGRISRLHDPEEAHNLI